MLALSTRPASSLYLERICVCASVCACSVWVSVGMFVHVNTHMFVGLVLDKFAIISVPLM